MITNIGAHYRLPIFSMMGEGLGVDFYLGDKVQTPLKTFDYHRLNGYRGTLHNAYIGPFYWQRGSVRLIFRPYRYYIIDGEPYCLSSWAQLLLAKLTGKRIIAWTHGWYGREGFVKRMVKKAFFALHFRLMVYSQYAITLMEKEGIAKEKMLCIANSMDTDREKEIRSRLHSTTLYKDHFGNDHPVVIYCGRIQAIKRLDLLVDCAKILADKGIHINIVFVGKDVDGVHIDRYAAEHGLADRIWMYGPCYDDERLAELFYNAAVCVSPGHVGLTAIHALSFGCPVITHDNFSHQAPEFEAIRPGVTGDFFRQNDAADLAEKTSRWLSTDAADREKTRAAAFAEIDSKWNIHYQMNILKQATYEG